MAERWQYRLVGTRIDVGGSTPQVDAELWLNELNRLGADGWEVVGNITVARNQLQISYLLLKRPYD